MSLLKDFYKITSLEKQADGKAFATITLNKNHDIFNGHFPDNPVTPGVCMMQIVKEISETLSESKLLVKSASNIKFMAIINPEETPDLLLEFDLSEVDDVLKVKNTTKFGETIALKMSVQYQKI